MNSIARIQKKICLHEHLQVFVVYLSLLSCSQKSNQLECAEGRTIRSVRLSREDQFGRSYCTTPKEAQGDRVCMNFLTRIKTTIV